MDEKMNGSQKGKGNQDLNIDYFMEMASKKTNLSDWGDVDFKEPLEKLLHYFDEFYPTDKEKRYSFGYTIIDILSKRLYIQDNFKKNGAILNTPIERPLFITGLPRTGTTLIHNLISQDPSWRYLLYYELVYPFMRDDIPNFEAYTINLVEQGLKALYSIRPEFISRHETRATGPEECFNLIKNTFYSIAWANEWYLPGYLEWFLKQDMTAGYAYYKKLLQLLMHRKGGKHLLLKCPAHLFNTDAISKVFPDSNIIWMHRDPCNSIGSGLSLLSVFHDISNGPDRFIDLYMEYFRQSLEKTMEIEQTRPSHIVSISYKKFVKGPVEVIREIYDKFGYTWDDSIETGIKKWLEENPQHKHGAHKYSLETFGLTQADLDKRFSKYYERYGNLL